MRLLSDCEFAAALLEDALQFFLADDALAAVRDEEMAGRGDRGDEPLEGLGRLSLAAEGREVALGRDARHCVRIDLELIIAKGVPGDGVQREVVLGVLPRVVGRLFFHSNLAHVTYVRAVWG